MRFHDYTNSEDQQIDATDLIRSILESRLTGTYDRVDVLRETFHLSTSWHLMRMCDHCTRRFITIDSTQVQIFPAHIADARFFKYPLRIVNSAPNITPDITIGMQECVLWDLPEHLHGILRTVDEICEMRRLSDDLMLVNCSAGVTYVERGSEVSVAETVVATFLENEEHSRRLADTAQVAYIAVATGYAQPPPSPLPHPPPPPPSPHPPPSPVSPHPSSPLPGIPLEENDAIIQGGKTPAPGEFPQLVMMLILSESTDKTQWPMSICSGTLLGTPENPFVITAKHCVDNPNLVAATLYGCGVQYWNQVQYMGADIADYMLKLYGADEGFPDVVYLYPEASRPATADELYRQRKVDIALIPVRNALHCASFSTNAKVLNASEKLKIAGYGLNTLSNGPTIGNLQYLDDQKISRIQNTSFAWRSSKTDQIYSQTEEIHMLATYQGLRGGDSGGPAFSQNTDLVGVASYTSMSDPMFSSHISTTQYEMSRWIENVLNLPGEKHRPDHSFMTGEPTELEAQSVTLGLESQSSAAVRRNAFSACLLFVPAVVHAYTLRGIAPLRKRPRG